ncbi:MAG: hypothetical protein KDB71_16470, partial [Mycobacterium sp.]|nr:hypothetical protein [Mycobacterium sp.]
QTLQTKTPQTNIQGESIRDNLTKQPVKTGKTKQSHPNTGVSRHDKKQKQQTKTTKHTIEFSNNTPARCPYSGQPCQLTSFLGGKSTGNFLEPVSDRWPALTSTADG